ncbi:hypothetical protein HYN59_14220 [Flavobacterium album]|uniref:Histidine kinase n=1 Tax=Flavobacterium album TaxID=2175091 RepID=A0A2S1R0I8_9FLAO|nr:hypothetical protein [Flavobacterium album]AWH86193.1 hypothetical protein HYN59_14220 [Flavobacterium album]
MKKLVILLIKFFTPLLVIIAIYAWLDPFKVVRHYDTYYKPYNKVSVFLDKDYISTANYDNRYEKEHYDSFIFGNSRSMMYQAAQWQKYIGAGSRPYHFDASNETLFGICKKIAYIDNKQEKLKNVLLVIDRQLLLQTKSNEGHLFEISPQLVNNKNFTDFHLTFFRASLTCKFLPGYVDYKVSGTPKPYMTGNVLDDIPFTYNAVINEMVMTDTERSIAEGTFYTAERMNVFYKRDTIQKVSEACIGIKQKQMLSEISSILKKHGTRLKIVINPLYNQEKLNPKDIAFLKRLFGPDVVYDLSGINSITNDYRNYYENSHYRPQVANIVLKKMYGGR